MRDGGFGTARTVIGGLLCAATVARLRAETRLVGVVRAFPWVNGTIDESLGDLTDKTGDGVVHGLTVEQAVSGVQDVELLFRTRDCNVGEAALLLHFRFTRGDRLHTGEESVLHTGEEDVGELQALCAVDGHEDHGIGAFVVAVNVGNERGPFDEILGKNIVIEEKIDGANSAISFDGNGNLLLQSRGHYLDGGYRERHYNLMKSWANRFSDVLYTALGDRYIMYGEWMYAKHTIFYDSLPDYFMEFDIFDRVSKTFLDTDRRKSITEPMGIISSVPVLKRGVFKSKEEVLSCLGPSNFITNNHIEVLRSVTERLGLDVERALKETEPSVLMEGLYIKHEDDGIVKSRVKFVRGEFLQCVFSSESHWQSRPIIPNQLKKHEY